MNGSGVRRLAIIYELATAGPLSVNELMERFQLGKRTIQYDLADIRSYFILDLQSGKYRINLAKNGYPVLDEKEINYLFHLYGTTEGAEAELVKQLIIKLLSSIFFKTSK